MTNEGVRVRKLPVDTTLEIAARVTDPAWSWNEHHLDALSAVTGLVVHDRADEVSIPVEHPDLPDSQGIIATDYDESRIIEIAIALTDVVDDSDQDARGALDDAFEEFAAALASRFGPSVDQTDRARTYRGGRYLVRLRNLGIALDLAIAPIGGPLDVDPIDRVLDDWTGAAGALGAALGTFGDLDFVRFVVDDRVVILATRHGDDLWLLATGPDDEVEPVPLSESEESDLRWLGFQPPLGDDADHSAQRTSWWYRLGLPVSLSTMVECANRILTATREVYSAPTPSSIGWYGAALSPQTIEALEATPLTRVP